jgi:lipopolysaccharide biosynthesis glycosyltransferase
MKNAIFQYFLPANGVGKLKHYKNETGIPEWGQYSVAHFAKYAESNNADHHFFTESFVNATSNYFEVCRVFLDPMFDQYDKVLYTDIDVMPKDISQNVFDIDVKDIAGWPEFKHREMTADPKWRASTSLKNRYKHFGSELVKPKTVKNDIRMINTGVVLWSKEARLKAREMFDDYEKWFHYKNKLLDSSVRDGGHSSHCLDQPYLNAMWTKYDFDVLEIDMKWNRFPMKDENYPCVFAHYVNDSRFNIPSTYEDLR